MSTLISRGMDTDFKILAEIDRYISSKTTSNIEDGLKDYPHIRSIFEKYNSIRSTEAICERMFSYAGKYFCSLH